MKCKGEYDTAGKNCPLCNRFMDDCDGAPDYEINDDGDWVEAADVEIKENQK